MAKTFSDLISLRELSENNYESVFNPEKMGNAANIAYGGHSLAVAVHAAFKSLPLPIPPSGSTAPTFQPYSIQGNYLGPALTDRPMQLSVQRIRDTKTFATRQVTVYQRWDGGQTRSCLLLVADFQVPEPASLLEYSRPPSVAYKAPGETLTMAERRQQLVEQGVVSAKVARAHDVMFGLFPRFFDYRPCTDGIAGQNLSGMAKTAVTTQDAKPLTEKTSADWVKLLPSNLPPAKSAALSAAALAFAMDGALSFMPLTHSHRFLDDAAACSSLDFSLRIFAPEVDMAGWHMRELKTHAGGNGRTYSEAFVWDELGNAVGCMTQQCILRPHKEKGRI